MICTFIIPSRKRSSILTRAIQSLETSSMGNRYQVLVRTDNDDPTTVVPNYDVVEEIRGPRMTWELQRDGYLMHELFDRIKGFFVTVMNDDMVLTGDWQRELGLCPSKHVAHPALHRLHNSGYHNDNRSCLPFIPKNVIMESNKGVGWDDAQVHKLYAMGWQPFFMRGVEVWHDKVYDKPT